MVKRCLDGENDKADELIQDNHAWSGSYATVT